jgi:hypothetical protein
VPTTLTIPVQGSKTVYETGVSELHRISSDEGVRKQIERDFAEARGSDTVRFHVQLAALSENDRRNAENTRQLLEAIGNASSELAQRAQDLSELLRAVETHTASRVGEAETSLSSQVAEARKTIWNQNEASLQTISTQNRENTERLAVDVRKLRDELVSLVDSRMTQADASFAALRGDLEVVKFLVMDLIKDRIGRADLRVKTH